jgi:hypothetical protein
MDQSSFAAGLSQAKRVPIDNAATILASTDIRLRSSNSCVRDRVAHALRLGRREGCAVDPV